MTHILLDSSLARYANNNRKFHYPGETLGDVISALCKTHKELSKFIFASPTELHPFINIFVDHKNVKDLLGLSTPLEKNHVIRILPGISGG